MAIEDRDLSVGTVLLGRTRGEVHKCTVIQLEDGKIGFQLEDGTIFKSPSSAGSAVMNGVSCNGWRFWSLPDADGNYPKAQRAPKAEKVASESTAEPKVRKPRKAKAEAETVVEEAENVAAQAEEGLLV